MYVKIFSSFTQVNINKMYGGKSKVCKLNRTVNHFYTRQLFLDILIKQNKGHMITTVTKANLNTWN